LAGKSKFSGNLPRKIEIFVTRIHDPQILNQIDATDHKYQRHRLRFYLNQFLSSMAALSIIRGLMV